MRELRSAREAVSAMSASAEAAFEQLAVSQQEVARLRSRLAEKERVLGEKEKSGNALRSAVKDTLGTIRTWRQLSPLGESLSDAQLISELQFQCERFSEPSAAAGSPNL